MEKDKALLSFVGQFNVSAVVEQVVNLIDATPSGRTHDFRNQINEDNIKREIADLNRKIQNLQATLHGHGEDSKEKLQFYITNGTDKAERDAVTEAKAWLQRSKAPSYIHDTVIAEARKSVDTAYYAAVQQWLDIVSEAIDPLNDIDFSGEQWHVAAHVAEAIQTKHTQTLSPEQCADLMLWHVSEALQAELSRRGYLLNHPTFNGLQPSPVALSIVHTDAFDKRNEKKD